MLTVFDSAFSPKACHHLHTAASLGGLGDECHTLFHRAELSPRTPLETGLDSVLRELGDDAPFVEYWWRDEWEHVEAHADVDEYLFERDETFRYPRNAHVLYLCVRGGVRGPTCVWERGDSEEDDPFGPMTVVPACEGRLLRFDGALMHAVPRPVDIWTKPHGVRAPPKKVDNPVRSVLLFNTWTQPPLNVDDEPATDPMESADEMAAEYGGAAVEELLAIMSAPEVECEPAGQWARVPVAREEAEEEPSSLRLSLLGGPTRRGHPERKIELATGGGLLDALVEPEKVRRLSR